MNVEISPSIGICVNGSPVHLLGPVVFLSDGPQEVGIIPEAVRVGGSYADDLFVHPLSSIIVATDFIDVVIDPFSPGFVPGIVPEGDDDEGGGHDRGDGGGARMADSRLLRVSSSGVGQGFFVGAGNAVRAAPGRIALTAARIPACASLVTSTTPSGSWGRGP